MADDETELDAEAQSFIDELLEGGFEYTHNGRVAGFATPETDPEEGTDDDDDDVVEDLEPAAAEPVGAGEPPAEDDTAERGAHSGRIELRGTHLTELEADGLLHLRKLLIDNPELSAQVNALVSGGAPVLEPEPAPPAAEAAGEIDTPDSLPEWLDPDDEVSVRLYRELEASKAEARRAAQVATGTVEEVRADAAARERQAHIDAAVDKFRNMHPDFTDEEVASVRLHTASTVNVPGVMANFPGDPVEGLVRAMEIGSLTDEGVRDKVLGKAQPDPTEEKDAKRQRSLSALSGSGGSPRRRAPKQAKPAGWNDVAKKLADELTALGGNN